MQRRPRRRRIAFVPPPWSRPAPALSFARPRPAPSPAPRASVKAPLLWRHGPRSSHPLRGRRIRRPPTAGAFTDAPGRTSPPGRLGDLEPGRESRVPMEPSSHVDLLAEERLAVLIVGDTLFVHGGLTKDLVSSPTLPGPWRGSTRTCGPSWRGSTAAARRSTAARRSSGTATTRPAAPQTSPPTRARARSWRRHWGGCQGGCGAWWWGTACRRRGW